MPIPVLRADRRLEDRLFFVHNDVSGRRDLTVRALCLREEEAAGSRGVDVEVVGRASTSAAPAIAQPTAVASPSRKLDRCRKL